MERGPDRDPQSSDTAWHMGTSIGVAIGTALDNLTPGLGARVATGATRGNDG